MNRGEWIARLEERKTKDLAISRKSKRKNYKRAKEAVFAYYGPNCRCCGENQPTMLAIDHIDGGGNKHRKAIARRQGGAAFYAWLVKQGLPDGYQVLCFNCNQSKHVLGTCAHTFSPSISILS